MSLLNTKHSDPASAADSIARNRASKVRKVLKSASDESITAAASLSLNRTATRYADHLLYDVTEYISQGHCDAIQARCLAGVALRARQACPS